MPIVNGYCTETEVREQLDDSTSQVVPQALIERAINATSRAIDRYCGSHRKRRFWQDPVAVTKLFRVEDACTAYVEDISTLTGLVITTDSGLDGTFATTWAASDFQLEPLNADGVTEAWWQIVAVGTRRFPVHARRATLQVDARFGWAQIPEPVNAAAILKSVSLLKRKDAPFGVAGFDGFGAVRITRADPDVMELLNEYVRPDSVGV